MLTVADLKRFAAVCGRCLTVFEPLHDDAGRPRKPEACAGAAIREVDQILADNGWNQADREETLRPLRKGRAGASACKGSIVAFRSRDFTHAAFWPETLPAQVHFGQQFLILPLLPGIMGSNHFWLLTLAMRGVHLYRGSPETLVEVRLPSTVPKSLNGAPERVDEFFRAVERGIRPLLLNDRHPLILAGVTGELSLYGCVNTYSPIVEQAIHGSPEHLTREVLHFKAAALGAVYASGAPDKALRDSDDAAARDLLATEAEEIREAAELGRVEHLMLSLPAFPSEEESLNAAALATIRHAGRVTVLDPARLSSGAAAILRFRDVPAGAVRTEEIPVREDG